MKIPTVKQCDTRASLLVRKRDGKCMYPACRATENLQCSHYHKRQHASTRFYMDNLITLCEWHHYKSEDGLEHRKNRPLYTKIMRDFLGEERWQELERRSRISMKMSSAIIEFLSL